MHSNHQEDMCGLETSVWLCYKKLKKRQAICKEYIKLKS